MSSIRSNGSSNLEFLSLSSHRVIGAAGGRGTGRRKAVETGGISRRNSPKRAHFHRRNHESAYDEAAPSRLSEFLMGWAGAAGSRVFCVKSASPSASFALIGRRNSNGERMSKDTLRIVLKCEQYRF